MLAPSGHRELHVIVIVTECDDGHGRDSSNHRFAAGLRDCFISSANQSTPGRFPHS